MSDKATATTTTTTTPSAELVASASATTNNAATAVRVNVDQRCPIQYVTVYNDRAEVTRLLQHHFDVEGTYDLVLEGFSPCVDQTSLHVSGGTGKACTILEVSYQTRYEDAAPPSELTPLGQLQNQLESVQADIDVHRRELTRLEKQRAWLDGRASKLMNQEGPSNAGDLESMQQFLEFYHKTLLKLDDDTTREQQEIKKLTDQQGALRSKINEHGVEAQANRRQERREVTITVHVAGSHVDVALEISYLISNCSWSASYDVRVSSAEANRQKTQLTYYGIIINKSQENWLDAQFSLSTATPSLGGTPPKLNTLKIEYYRPRYNYPAGGERFATVSACGLMDGGEFVNQSASLSLARSYKKKGFMTLRGRSSLNGEGISEDGDSTVNVLASKAEASMSSSSFTIPRRSTIEADGKPHKVTVGVLDLTSTFTYTVVPKLSLHAYLKASTTNTSDKQLLAGPASVFMDNNFVTHSFIDNVCLGDTFDLPLGTDASVKVEYKPVKKMTDTQGLISKVHHENVRHETHLVNTKSTDVTVFVYEQVPLSSDEKIKVKLVLPELKLKEQGLNCTVTMNDANNLEWKCVLQARGECRLPLEYTIEWPKDKRVEFKQE